jgi:hypothetical protein
MLDKTLKRYLRATGMALSLLAAPAIARAQTFDFQAQMQAEAAAGGAWHYQSIPCANATVTEVTPRLRSSMTQTVFTPQDYDQSGVQVGFRLSQPWRYLGNLTTSRLYVVHYQGTSGNDIMRSERAGDSVQLCLTGFPLPRIDPTTQRVICNPDKDGRGFEFRVYDYRLHAAYIGPNSEHSCGGA